MTVLSGLRSHPLSVSFCSFCPLTTINPALAHWEEPCSYEPGTLTIEHKTHSVMVTAGLQLQAQPGVRGSWVAPLLTPRLLSCPCTLPPQRAISLINRGRILFLFLCSPVQSFCYCFVNLLKSPNFLLEYSRTKYVPEFSTVRF